MISLLKTIALPLLFTLPWALVNLNENWEKFFHEKVTFQPVWLFLILLPGILIVTRWLAKSLANQGSHR